MKQELAEPDLKQIIKNVRIIKNEISDVECLSRILENIIVDEAIDIEIGDDQTILMIINKRFKTLKNYIFDFYNYLEKFTEDDTDKNTDLY